MKPLDESFEFLRQKTFSQLHDTMVWSRAARAGAERAPARFLRCACSGIKLACRISHSSLFPCDSQVATSNAVQCNPPNVEPLVRKYGFVVRFVRLPTFLWKLMEPFSENWKHVPNMYRKLYVQTLYISFTRASKIWTMFLCLLLRFMPGVFVPKQCWKKMASSI